jgi:hypothetical protein
MPDNKPCFVIAPIGKEGSDIRKRSDQVLQHIITPAAKECGYEPIRADQISEPGIITSQIIERLMNDELVIADLTGHNPNVFYELAVRHAVRKPVVQMISMGETIPFDIAASRTIQVDHHDLDSVANAKTEMVKQIRAVERNPGEVDTPLSTAIQIQALRTSDNPLEKSSAEIIEMLQDMRSMMSDLGEDRPRPRMHPGMIEEFVHMYERIDRCLDPDESGGELSQEQIDRARSYLRRMEHFMMEMCMESGMSPAMMERMMHRRRKR